LKHLTDADIQAYLDDNLVDDARWVEDHTNACDTCRKRLAEYRALYLQLADDSALPVFDGLSDAVMARATRDGSSKERSGFVDVILAAGGAVLVFVTFLFVSDISPLTAGLADLGRSAGQLFSAGAQIASAGSGGGFRTSVVMAAAAAILIAYLVNGLPFCRVKPFCVRDRSRQA
jgi:anti-sigma factor RsiW